MRRPPPEVPVGARLPMPEISRSFMQAPDRAFPDLDVAAADMGQEILPVAWNDKTLHS